MALLKDLIVLGNSRFIGEARGLKFITEGGTSSLFVKGDGTLDSTQYYLLPQDGIPASDLTSGILSALLRVNNSVRIIGFDDESTVTLAPDSSGRLNLPFYHVPTKTSDLLNDSGFVTTLQPVEMGTATGNGNAITSLTILNGFTIIPNKGTTFLTSDSLVMERGSGTTSVLLKGASCVAGGNYSFAEGYDNQISTSSDVTVPDESSLYNSNGQNSHVEGQGNRVSGPASHAEGQRNKVTSRASHAEGKGNVVTGNYTHAEGLLNKVSAEEGHVEGFLTEVVGIQGHAEGWYTYVGGRAGHAEGYNTQANGLFSHAEGQGSLALNQTAHAEGESCEAVGLDSHVEGYNSKTGGSDTSNTKTAGSYVNSGAYAHAEGNSTIAKGLASHSEGTLTFAVGNSSHAEGKGTITNNEGEHAEGKFNVSNTSTISSIGIGTDDSHRQNALEVNSSGNIYINGLGGYEGASTKDKLDLVSVINGIKGDDFKPLGLKTFSNYTCAAANVDKGYIYFLNVIPTDENFFKPWFIRYTLEIETSTNACQGYYDITIGYSGTSLHYRVFNKFYSSSYYPTYYHTVLQYDTAAKYGNRADNPIKLGERIYSAYGTTTVARTYKIKVYQAYGCTFSFPDNIETYDSVYNSSKYGTGTTMNATSNGIIDNYDANDTTTINLYYTRLIAGTGGMMLYSLVMEDGNGKWLSFTTTSGTGEKTKNTTGFKPGSHIYYNGYSSNIAENGLLPAAYLRSNVALVDFRYSFNSITANSLGNGLTYGKPLYVVGTINPLDELFYLDGTKWWTLDEPTSDDGKIYIKVTEAVYPDYNTSTMPSGNYRGDLISSGEMWRYKNGKFRKYIPLELSNDYLPLVTGEPESGDSFETAIEKLHGILLEDEEIIADSLVDLNNRIPTSVSQLTNDSGFITTYEPVQLTVSGSGNGVKGIIKKSGTQCGLIILKDTFYLKPSTGIALGDLESSIQVSLLKATNSVLRISSSTDNAIVRFNGTGGAVQNSGVTIDDSNNITAAKFITSGGTSNQVILGNGNLQAAVELPQYEAYLQWGGKNFNASYGPIDAAMISDLGANRLQFLKVAGITVEYSLDDGVTWYDYGASDSLKVSLFSTNQSFVIGKGSAGNSSPSYKLRVTIDSLTGGIYSTLNKFVIFVSTNGSDGCYCTISARTLGNFANNVDTWATFADQVPISGWSGYNVINTSGITTCGNTENTSQYRQVRFTFGCTEYQQTATRSGLVVYRIMGFGGVGWTCPSTMAKTGHLYSFDYALNAGFPGGISATYFKKSGGTSSQFLKADGSVDSTSYGTYSKPSGGIPKSDLSSEVLNLLTSSSLSSSYNGTTAGEPVSNDSVETAISKLHHMNIENEKIVAAALNKLNNRIELLENYIRLLLN